GANSGVFPGAGKNGHALTD
ncbi:hypothetical protein A2U01_0075023, partial [Trifolium medium]|nr:hypothetical protein [Trifolium medium]